MENSKIITIIIPCYNEIRSIGLIVYKIYKLQDINKKISIADDYLIDRTEDYLKN